MLNKNVDISKHKNWIEKAVAFSRLMVDDKSLTTQITQDTKFHLSYVYAAAYWLPMRKHSPPLKSSLLDNINTHYQVRTPRMKKSKSHNSDQISLYPIGGENDDDT